jgi:hypothetical protein
MSKLIINVASSCSLTDQAVFSEPSFTQGKQLASHTVLQLTNSNVNCIICRQVFCGKNMEHTAKPSTSPTLFETPCLWFSEVGNILADIPRQKQWNAM